MGMPANCTCRRQKPLDAGKVAEFYATVETLIRQMKELSKGSAGMVEFRTRLQMVDVERELLRLGANIEAQQRGCDEVAIASPAIAGSVD